ncbi:MAG TPA: hypothetical protein VJ802_15780 [Gemmatimonadaceae bacterium]|nr:hypothetical protein [Gemmatimonadaceae bacterium]
MKDLAMAVGLVALSLGLVAGAVFGLGDDEILAMPPENVVQEFIRALALGQTGAARDKLSRDAERATSSAEMRRISAEFRARIGELQEVEGRVARRGRDTTVVRARIKGERSNAEPLVSLARESGEWTVVRAADVLAIDASPRASREVER